MGQFSGLMGKGSGDALAAMLQSAGSQSHKSGTIATIIGIVTLLITASGAFGGIQSSLTTDTSAVIAGKPSRENARYSAYRSGVLIIAAKRRPRAVWP
jgi:hypothetical protein